MSTREWWVSSVYDPEADAFRWFIPKPFEVKDCCVPEDIRVIEKSDYENIAAKCRSYEKALKDLSEMVGLSEIMRIHARDAIECGKLFSPDETTTK
jgi:hypothetical protein